MFLFSGENGNCVLSDEEFEKEYKNGKGGLPPAQELSKIKSWLPGIVPGFFHCGV
jgi:hypothetical protein